MAAHLGTGIQMASVGPQNAYLDLAPQVTAFRHRHQRCTRHATEPQERRPLQEVGFGGVAVFDVSTGGDMLGDMHVQVAVPAVQPRLGHLDGPDDAPLYPGLPAHDGWQQGTQPAVAPSGAYLSLQGFPALGLRASVPGGATLHSFADAGMLWYVLVHPDGRVLSHIAEAPGGGGTVDLVVTQMGGPVTTVPQRVGVTLALFVAPGGEVAARNDTWQDPLAYALMRRARFVVDGYAVHDHERLWYDLLDRLTLPAGQAAGLRDMLGVGLSMGRAHTVLLPLKFMCCSTPHTRRKRSFFPRLLLPKSVIRVEVELESLAGCAPAGSVVPTREPAALDVRLVAELVFLDADERAGMLLQPRHTLMYEGVQDMDAANYDESALDGGRPARTNGCTVDLSELNLPVRALVWVLYAAAPRPARYFDYVDAVEEATLLYGSLERAVGGGPAFSKQQVWSFGGRCAPGGNVYLYSFALRPWSPDPSGAADFSLVSKPTLRLLLTPEAKAQALRCKVFGATYNWLHFEQGRMRHAFSA